MYTVIHDNWKRISVITPKVSHTMFKGAKYVNIKLIMMYVMSAYLNFNNASLDVCEIKNLPYDNAMAFKYWSAVRLNAGQLRPRQKIKWLWQSGRADLSLHNVVNDNIAIFLKLANRTTPQFWLAEYSVVRSIYGETRDTAAGSECLPLRCLRSELVLQLDPTDHKLEMGIRPNPNRTWTESRSSSSSASLIFTMIITYGTF